MTLPCVAALAAGRDDWLSENPADQERAKLACKGCPEIVRCLQDARESGDVWTVRGGLSGDERKRLRPPSARVRVRVRGLPEHGTRSRYLAGCDDGDDGHACRKCLRAHARYVADWRRRTHRDTHRETITAVEEPSGQFRLEIAS